MILRRLGSKKKIAKEIQKHFPPHKIYIEPFFGAGGMFFNKPKAKYNIVNDLDSDVFNLFQVVMNQKEELENVFYLMPIHSDLLEYWKQNKETEPVKKALRFLFLKNLTFMGQEATLRLNAVENSKSGIQKNIKNTFELLEDVRFSNNDFSLFLKSIAFRTENEIKQTFIYNDPPYIGTGDKTMYEQMTQKDHIRLHDSLEKTGCNFAISEFDNPFVIEEAKKRNLNIIYIGERQNLKNKRTEILITNYKLERTLF